MNSFIFAFLNPLLSALQGILAKKGLLNVAIPDEAVVFARLFYGVPLFIGAMLIGNTSLEIQSGFWVIMLIMICAEIPSQWFLHQAYKEKKMALVAPLISLLSVLLVITSPIIEYIFHKQLPTLTAVNYIGMGIIVACNYLLHSDADVFKKRQFFDPLKRMLSEKSSRYMVLTVLLWTITTHLQPIAVEKSNLLLMSAIYLSGASLGVILIPLIRTPVATRLSVVQIISPKFIKQLLPIGLIAGVASLCQYQAMLAVHPAVMIGIKETMLIWAVIFDFFFFKQTVNKTQMIIIANIIIGSILMSV